MTETAHTFLAGADGQVVVVQLSDASGGGEHASSRATARPGPSSSPHDRRSLARDRQLRGKLSGADDFINLVLEDVEEVDPKGTRRISGPVVVRGSQVIAVHAAKLGPPLSEPRHESAWSGPRADRGGYYPPRRDAGDRGWVQRRE